MERTLKVTIAYDGSNFKGWQTQRDQRTAQGEVQKVLDTMHRKKVTMAAAGRTDSGVHARGQVISFRSHLDISPLSRFTLALNSFLPPDVKAVKTEEVPEGFNARFDALRRIYKYYILPSRVPFPHARLYSWRINTQPSLKLLQDMAARVMGTHDFTTFSMASDQFDHAVRTVYDASFYSEGDYMVFRISGRGFLWRMVRSLVGSMVDFASNGLDGNEMEKRLAARNRLLAGTTAPAHGLFLEEVLYSGDPGTLASDSRLTSPEQYYGDRP